MEMIATVDNSYMYSGILLQTTVSVSILCLLLSCCGCPFVSWWCTMLSRVVDKCLAQLSVELL